MSYYKKVLRDGEVVHFAAHIHWFVYLRGLAVAFLAAAAAVAAMVLSASALKPVFVDMAWGVAAILGAVAAILLVRAALKRATTEIVVTDLRVIHKRGLVSRHTVEMNISKIETVDVDQGLIGRMFSYGTVLIRGTGAGFEPLRNVSHPVDLRNAILVG